MYPTHCWYVAATGAEVTDVPLGRRALGQGLALYRTPAGRVVALEDRDAHAPYPLSLGHLDGELIVSAYSGFAYDPDGRCVRVPTQPEVPYGAGVRAFPVVEQDGLVWVWFAGAGLAGLRHPPRTPWLADDAWSTFGDEWTTGAGALLLHENFADITHVAVVDPLIAPPALSAGPVPGLDVEVSETSVAFTRDYPPARLAAWHAPLIDAKEDELFRQREQGRFVSPALWVDSWDVTSDRRPEPYTFRFTHAVTPVGATTTRHIWRVSRNFAAGDEVSAQLTPLFREYYRRVRDILETMQRVLDEDGPRPEVRVAADAAAIQVRKIVGRMVADETTVLQERR
ncbi:aromatic ring-hydroxylating dioxygenase subunit alpha [Actinoplanes bogorensis]|uniref:Aromatic ring-hydroxylating dioxygenase subunit alpha n=1 Tax=Paractinoplanes bogorensis TaxID=1610840 RepID=A0ABS5YV96_9ACTN|nr:aromatic ring-hydroxylating dioxygenase subunit alpha [Actinoplanes bogorensis]MBU2667340.1 aromatic ring-hydroxylating dioxygenase subunit alpha [Actinoplanes bogorensis]